MSETFEIEDIVEAFITIIMHRSPEHRSIILERLITDFGDAKVNLNDQRDLLKEEFLLILDQVIESRK